MPSPSDCCNPTARTDQERCLCCPMRKSRAEVVVGQPTQAAQAKTEKPTAPVRRSTVWQLLHDEIQRE